MLNYYCVRLSEAVALRCSVKKVPLKTAKNLQENSYARGLRLWHRCFPVNFAKFFRTTFFRRTSPVAASRLFVSSFYSYGKLWFLAVKILFCFELSCNTCQCFLTLCNIYTKTHISIYRTHIYIYRTHMSIYIISCCNFVTRKNLWICIKWNYLILSTPDCDMK